MSYPAELTSTYEIYQKIGEGGGGEVYVAMHKRLQKKVVLKKIKSSVSIKDCRIEVDILKNLRHSYLPQVIDFIEIWSQDGQYIEGIYTVMDYIPGKSLQNMMDEGHKFSEQEVLKYAKQLCEALSYLHSQNPPIIHGDIKPDNIMITPEGNVCLIDFNISGVLEGQGIELLGLSYGYASPEQIQAGEEMKRQMVAERIRRAQNRQMQPQRQQLNDRTKILPQNDPDKTVLLSSPDPDATVLMGQQDPDATVLLNREVAASMEYVPPVQKAPVQEPPFKPTISVVIDKRSDVFSVGATLYKLLTGKFYDYTAKKRKVPMPSVSDGFLIVLAKSLEKKADKRYTDAGVMLQALLLVHKKDKAYRRLLFRQELTLILFALGIAASAFLMIEGRRTMELEIEQKYDTLIAVMEEGVENELTLEQFDESYNAAIDIHSEDVAPYYARAYFLFATEGVEVAQQYMDQVLDMRLEGSEDIFCNLYHLYGECRFRQEDYEQAQWYYARAIKYRDDNPVIYRDYAISLVYLNRVAEAELLLEEASQKGMDKKDIYMVQGEIERISKNYGNALECFKNVINATEDEYLMQRAYIMGSKTYESIGTTEALLDSVEWLTQGMKKLSRENKILLYERMVQEYISLGEATKEVQYYEKAIENLQEIIDMGWDSYLTFSNIVVLYQRIGNVEEARNWAEKMCAEYPNHYVSYMRLAFTELEITNAEPEDDRDYSEFLEYYNQANERYAKQMSGNVTNSEMLLLDNVYQQLIDGNWIKE